MNKEEVLKLAKLARIEIPDSEAESLAHEFDVILKYVGEIKNASHDLSRPSPKLGEGKGGVNVMREDANPHESGIFTESLLNEAPDRKGDYVRVKQIL